MYNRSAEWRSPKEIWVAWPHDKNLWTHHLPQAEQEVLGLVEALRLENLVVVVPNQEEYEQFSRLVPGSIRLSIKVMPFGDIWIRDTFPIAVKNEGQSNCLVIPRFNGWGQKYLFGDDRDLSARVAIERKEQAIASSIIFEGGAIECDGQGTLLTTEQCLLNPNRNPGVTKEQIEEEFSRLFGIRKVIWIKEGLLNDHTDGHIDTIARFIAPHTVAIMVPAPNDPNYQVMMAIKEQLESETDALGRKLELLQLPSPGAIVSDDGELMPASYLNFIIGDASIVVPTYGSPYDNEAIRILREFSPLEVHGRSARAILTGGGAFHCMSQEFYR